MGADIILVFPSRAENRQTSVKLTVSPSHYRINSNGKTKYLFPKPSVAKIINFPKIGIVWNIGIPEFPATYPHVFNHCKTTTHVELKISPY